MITFEHVSKHYPGGTVAVDSLDLECPTGQITVLVGLFVAMLTAEGRPGTR